MQRELLECGFGMMSSESGSNLSQVSLSTRGIVRTGDLRNMQRQAATEYSEVEPG